MKLLVLSDLHNEFGLMQPNPETIRLADAVVLAGDIYTDDRSVAWARAFVGNPIKPIILIAGNHEFYGGHFDETLTRLRAAASKTNVHFLENDEWIMDGVRFLGCTLWTSFVLPGEAFSKENAIAEAVAHLDDFSEISASNERRTLRPDDTIERHLHSRAWLTSALRTRFPGKTVVVTHHAPSMRSIENRFSEDLLSPAFASDLDDLMGPLVDLWIHGHMHASFDYRVQGTRVVCNPRGYHPRQVNPKFDPCLVIDI